MTPREIAESTDVEVLRDTVRRAFLLGPPDSKRKAIIESGDADALVQLARQYNARQRPGMRIKHGLIGE